MSWSLLHAAEIKGIKVMRVKIKPKTPFSFLGNKAMSKIERETALINPNKKKYQYSALLALPLNIAYFWKQVLIDAVKKSFTKGKPIVVRMKGLSAP